MRLTALRASGAAVAIAAVCAMAAAPAGAEEHGHGHGRGHGHVRGTYLALGDSLAFGYSQAKFEALAPQDPAAAFDTGYVDDFARFLKRFEHVQVVNDGCPGETTESMMKACAYQEAGLPLHHPYPKESQLSNALAYIAAHPGEVGTISIDIGANDALGVAEVVCKLDPTCVAEHAPALLAQIGANLGSILAQLRAAAPEATIVVVGLYDPFPALSTIVTSEPMAQQLNAFTVALNGVLAQGAAAVHAIFANPFSRFNVEGTLEAEQASLCKLTNMCNHIPPDIHPTNHGYREIARAIEQAYLSSLSSQS
ncbi:MAG: SGNH/GDSL hydrolase family protein [Solirubrobacterales bacterium]|nr:SGNH/GDSL hydrolase family protein [Solirubrobacterales bacterium]